MFIFPKPELTAFWGDSPTKPHFWVTHQRFGRYNLLRSDICCEQILSQVMINWVLSRLKAVEPKKPFFQTDRCFGDAKNFIIVHSTKKWAILNRYGVSRFFTKCFLAHVEHNKLRVHPFKFNGPPLKIHGPIVMLWHFGQQKFFKPLETLILWRNDSCYISQSW